MKREGEKILYGSCEWNRQNILILEKEGIISLLLIKFLLHSAHLAAFLHKTVGPGVNKFGSILWNTIFPIINFINPYLPEVGYNIYPRHVWCQNYHSCQYNIWKICYSTWLIDNHLCSLSHWNLSQIYDALGAVGGTPDWGIITPTVIV